MEEEESYGCYTTMGCSDKVVEEYQSAQTSKTFGTSTNTEIQSASGESMSVESSAPQSQGVQSSESQGTVQEQVSNKEPQSQTQPVPTEKENADEEEYEEEEYFDERPEISTKNPVQLLNEMLPSLDYKLVKDGEDEFQLKLYTMAVEVDGEMYEGSARSKKDAKKEAAKEALLMVYNIQCVPDHENPYHYGTYRKLTKVGSQIDPDMGPHYSCKNPVMQLHELHKDTRYFLKAEGYSNNVDRYFTMATVISGRRFEATSKNKKFAKQEVAKIALRCVYNVHIVSESEMPPIEEGYDFDPKNPGFNFGSKRRSSDKYGVNAKYGKFEFKYDHRKNPMTQLYEVRPYLEFHCSGNTGSPGRPWYEVTVEMDEAVYEGCGSSYKSAKYEATVKCLKALETYGKTFKKRMTGTEESENSKKQTEADGITGPSAEAATESTQHSDTDNVESDDITNETEEMKEKSDEEDEDDS